MAEVIKTEEQVERELSPQEEAVHDSIDTMEDLQQEAKDNLEDLLELLDLDQLLQDPANYLKSFAEMAVLAHAKHVIQKAEKAGQATAQQFINKSKES